MRFQRFHKRFFKSSNGAFSRVTEREAFDSQITLTDEEFDIVTNYFGIENIHIGNVKSNKVLSSKQFLSYQTNRYIHLNLVFPKKNKSELRLYLSTRAGFKPTGGMILFLFENKNNDLVIGALDESTWSSLGQFDIDDPFYIESINNIRDDNIQKDQSTISFKEESIKPDVVEVSGRKIFKRDAKLALQRFAIEKFTCEISKEHQTFISSKTQKAFVEAHHFIPMMYQDEFNFSLDQLGNIICLCPNCHRAFHHAIVSQKVKYIENIYDKRPSLHSLLSLSDIKGLYNCYAI